MTSRAALAPPSSAGAERAPARGGPPSRRTPYGSTTGHRRAAARPAAAAPLPAPRATADLVRRCCAARWKASKPDAVWRSSNHAIQRGTKAVTFDVDPNVWPCAKSQMPERFAPPTDRCSPDTLLQIRSAPIIRDARFGTALLQDRDTESISDQRGFAPGEALSGSPYDGNFRAHRPCTARRSARSVVRDEPSTSRPRPAIKMAGIRE